MTYFERSAWGARPPRSGPGPLRTDEVAGIALHWPAMKTPLRGVLNVKAALRGWQAYHMDDKGWSDIAYQEAIDQEGNVYELRGLRITSGANGGTSVNARYGALLLVLAPDETPTPQMMTAVRDRIAEHRRMFSKSTQIVGHGQIRPEPTSCPGPIAQALINQGKFEPVTTPTNAQRKKARQKTNRVIDYFERHNIPGAWWLKKAKKKTHKS